MKKLLLIFITLLMLVGCSSKISNIEDDYSNLSKTDAENLKENMTNYKGAFTASIPENWKVQMCDSGFFTWIRIYDPENPVLAVNVLIKADELLKSKEAKSYYQGLLRSTMDPYQYGEIANSIVVEHVEDFYEQIDEYCDFMKKYYEEYYEGFEGPAIENLKVLESKDTKSEAYFNEPYEQKILHATYNDPVANKEGEGIFLGVLVDSLTQRRKGVDVGYRAMYNCVYLSAPKGQLDEYFDLLLEIYKSIQFSDALYDTIGTDLNIIENKAKAADEVLKDNDKVISDFWENRDKSISASLVKEAANEQGYEMVIGSDNNLYKAYKGFTNTTTDKRFSLAKENDCSNKVAGYIVKK